MTDPYALRMTAVSRPIGGLEAMEWWVNLSLPWFRSLPYSCVEDVALTVDGRAIPRHTLVARRGSGVLALDELSSLSDYWGVQDTLQVGLPAGSPVPPAGSTVEARVTMRMPDGHAANGEWTRRHSSATTSMRRADTGPWSLGACSFSFAGELRRGRSLASCLAELGAVGGFASVELLGAQAVDGYPTPSRTQVSRIVSSVRDAGLVPLSYGGYTDPGRQLEASTDDDLLRWTTDALDTAAAIGATYARINLPPRHNVLDRAAELAAGRGLVLLTELHAMTSADPFVQQLLDIYAQLDSPHLGLTLDLSCVMRRLPGGFVDALLRPALPDEVVKIILDGWANGDAEGTVLDAIAKTNTSALESARPLLTRTYRLFRHSNTEWLPDVLPYTHVVHGKFFEIADGEDPSVPLADVFTQLSAHDFAGHIMAEFEAHLWDENPATFEQLARFRDLTGALTYA